MEDGPSDPQVFHNIRIRSFFRALKADLTMNKRERLGEKERAHQECVWFEVSC